MALHRLRGSLRGVVMVVVVVVSAVSLNTDFRLVKLRPGEGPVVDHFVVVKSGKGGRVVPGAGRNVRRSAVAGDGSVVA
jgi:hypothetical protein